MMLTHNPVLELGLPSGKMPADSLSRTLHFPAFLASWPYPRRLNPHRKPASQAASKWFASCGLLPPSAQSVFDKYDSGLLAALAYPDVDEAHLRTVCDALNIVFLFDDYSDTQSPSVVRAIADEIINALGGSTEAAAKPELTSSSENYLKKFGDATRSFWSRAVHAIPISCQRRFVSAFTTYCAAIVQQAYDRTSSTSEISPGLGNVRNVDSYIVLRRDTIGARLAFALVDIGFNENQDEKWLFEDPLIVELENAAIDIISFANDSYSYDREQANGDEAHNILTCIMRAENIPLQDAMNSLGRKIAALEERFSNISTQISDSINGGEGFEGSDVDEQSGRLTAPSSKKPHLMALTTYIDALGTWVRANDAWSFESVRYFGEKGAEVQKDRCLVLQ